MQLQTCCMWCCNDSADVNLLAEYRLCVYERILTQKHETHKEALRCIIGCKGCDARNVLRCDTVCVCTCNYSCTTTLLHSFTHTITRTSRSSCAGVRIHAVMHAAPFLPPSLLHSQHSAECCLGSVRTTKKWHFRLTFFE
jgi:hypothetical protein